MKYLSVSATVSMLALALSALPASGQDLNATIASKSGDFAYFCGLHPHMRGKIAVSP